MLAALGLGSNIGNKLANINYAVDLLNQSQGIQIVKRSSNYRTEPWGIENQDWFVNICLLIDTNLKANTLLNRCLDIEQEFGRVRNQKWGPRIIDIDVLIYGEEIIKLDGLTIPHPRMTERSFVLIPLAEIWPHAKINGQSVLDARNLLNDLDDIQLLENEKDI